VARGFPARVVPPGKRARGPGSRRMYVRLMRVLTQSLGAATSCPCVAHALVIAAGVCCLVCSTVTWKERFRRVLNVENNWVSKRKKQTVLKLRWYRSLRHAPPLDATPADAHVADNPFRVAVRPTIAVR
jgi:hypothetical protein